MSQQNPQPPVRTPRGNGADRPNPGGRALLLGLICALALAAGLPAQSKAEAEEAAAEASASGAPAPAPVPEPPENAADEEALIELPITPAATGETAAESASAPAGRASDGRPGPAAHTDELDGLRVLFPADGTAIDAAGESDLLRLAGYLSHHQAQRVVLHAHAGGSDQGSSHARRLSLTRALAVRTFLVDQGVPANRIYLRPLGSQREDGPPDRVDILPLRP